MLAPSVAPCSAAPHAARKATRANAMPRTPWRTHAPGSVNRVPLRLNERRGRVGRAQSALRATGGVFELVTPERGFLPVRDPLERLPGSEFDAWEEALHDVPKRIVAADSGNLQRWLQSLPPFPMDALLARVQGADDMDASAEAWRAMQVISFLAHAYMWGDPHMVPQRLPAVLAAPWAQVAGLLDVPPILTYATYNLLNWRRLDKNGPIELGNICCLHNFYGGVDEEWFRCVHVEIEARAGLAVAGAGGGQAAAAAGDVAGVRACLAAVHDALEGMHDSLDRMGEKCDPHIYYARVRGPMGGWKNNSRLPNGLVYEGVSDEPRRYFGETGAQSSIIPTLDALLGIDHASPPPVLAAGSSIDDAGAAGEEGAASASGAGEGGGAGGGGAGGCPLAQTQWMVDYLREMRGHMPGAHRRHIEALEAGAGLRAFVLREAPELRHDYNVAVDALERFRTQHAGFARAYIARFSAKERGTGGSDFMPALRRYSIDTHAHLVNE